MSIFLVQTSKTVFHFIIVQEMTKIRFLHMNLFFCNNIVRVYVLVNLTPKKIV